MKRTKILCPECFKKKLLKGDGDRAYCDDCGTEFIMLSPYSVKYK